MAKIASNIVQFRPPKQVKNPDIDRTFVTKLQKRVKKPRKLPKYVNERKGIWFVRRNFKSTELDKHGNPKYIQISRVCHEQTAEAAHQIALQIAAEVAAPRRQAHTLKGFLDQYLRAKKPSISTRTFESTEMYFKRITKLLPMAIDEIKPIDIQRQYDALNASPMTVREINKRLSTAFNIAIQWELITKNPCKPVILPKVVHEEVSAFTHTQAKEFIAECRKTDDNIVLEFALETGMRPQEYLALRWSDLSGHTVKIRRAVIRGLAGGGFHYADTKTKGSRRTVQISPQLRERLDVQKKKLSEMTRKLNKRVRTPPTANRKKVRSVAREILSNLKEHDLIFPSGTGLPQSINNLNRRRFKNIVADIGLDAEEFSLYSLRHTCATLLIASGVDLKTVADKLGHSDSVMLLRTYAHVLPKMKSDATDRLAEVLY